MARSPSSRPAWFTTPDSPGTPITSHRQAKALISPARQEILDALESAGPRSVAELAALLGRAPDALYFHLRQLQRVGLIIETQRRKTGRHVAVIYDIAFRPVRISYSPPVRPNDICAIIASALRLTTRDFKRAIVRKDITVEGPRRDLWAVRAKGWVTPSQLERINVLLHELSSLVRSGAPGPDTRPVSITFVLAPSPASPRAETPVERRTRKFTRRSQGAKA